MRIPYLPLVSALMALASSRGEAVKFEPNYDEAKIPAHTLPDPLKMEDGSPVTTAEQWRDKRRPEILRLFEQHVFGRIPGGKPTGFRAEKTGEAEALGGLAIRREVTLYFKEGAAEAKARVLIYLPRDRQGPVPAFVGLNFQGNHAISADEGITLNTDATERGGKGPSKRGAEASRWPVETILKRGYALVTCWYGDFDPDFDDGFRNGVHPLFQSAGWEKPTPDEWGSIGAWAWGCSRILDHLETDSSIQAKRVALLGHSRLGKTSLWAGATDERFALVISNNSGCGGAALSRRAIGETVGRINRSFPHWFCDRHNDYNENEGQCPVDHHELIALIAPRPVYVASAEEDRWADPRGEFLGAKGADPVYRLLTGEGLDAKDMPAVDQPVISRIGYHIRAGKHDVTDFDWARYLDFADRFMK
jgi:hypothetical protein